MAFPPGRAYGDSSPFHARGVPGAKCASSSGGAAPARATGVRHGHRECGGSTDPVAQASRPVAWQHRPGGLCHGALDCGPSRAENNQEGADSGSPTGGMVMRRFLAVLAVLALAGPAAAEVKTKEITFKSGDDDVKGYLALPEGKGPFPAIVVIQEWWGLTDWIKENARHFAERGYVALAPDLYRGKATADPAVARKLMS